MRLFHRPKKVARRLDKRHVVALSGGLLGVTMVGVLLFSAGSFWWTSQPSFCNRCHVMNKYVDTWSASAHHDVTCERCHLSPGLFGFLGGKITGLQVVMNYIRGNYEDYSFNASVQNASCLECHSDLLARNFTDRKTGVTVSHLHIIQNGGKCMNCHSTVAHGSAVPPGSATFPTMDTCLKCHNGTIAPTDCDLCHRSGTPNGKPPVQPTSVPGA
jgi:nitrate/TMAO reductase-like tetraheme cytochrome c subunit